MSESPIPVVMCFSGLDPTGGAGIQADIETLASMGGHAAPIITALTVQDTVNASRFDAVDPMLLIEQARSVLEDMPIAAFKLGMLGSVEVIEAIHSILMDYPDIPLVLDPVLVAGGGGPLADEAIVAAMKNLLMPQATVLTPNSEEARRLAPEADTLDACGQELLDLGPEYVLITGGHEPGPHIDNRLYANHRQLETFSWDRLPHHYHGSGCTLSSGIAGLLAQGLDPFAAIHEAQEFTWHALQQGFRPGMGQHVPNRLFWARGDEE
ncbi:hydroxymethylpyrimidine/phosphomethylpyrimidine kinase [Thiohalophilus sp.]|uniref:bifunctional hydroxymethylpyrimidine kinase/phosphomethylpyrimidine kinase n=1 Tax=Thiohalophilus sp. TaxID=3028392 RepID=UPI002ACD5CE4|nr:hydroxymethylpyrimidine/phosphomethylpyrimidine kinase [Thiohalophilus sp.]MDZ7805162.1 hydroxymethylpyrimidine/phosphomethylpyrimidine kinase [Thiohalophilus sp.]